ncbi:MAG: ureidoglycolate lyase [Castellaniella sp.]|uniref:ureidoglycolate lyase n=1 Tax=Castellaniella sp. TaxID=1955812 RepID=UPI003C738435
MRLHPQLLSDSAFAPYGEVIEHTGDAPRRPMAVPFDAPRADVHFGMTVNRLPHVDEPVIHVELLERHPHSPQTFIPLGGVTRSLVVVACSTPDGALDLSTLRAFICAPNQGVVYRLAVWHYAFTSIDSHTEVAVILGRTHQGDDTEYTRLQVPVEVMLQEVRRAQA